MSSDTNAKFVLNTYSYTLGGPVENCLPGFAERGFTELELMMYPGHLWPLAMDAAARSKLAGALGDLGLRVRTLNQPNVDLNLAAASEEMRRHTLAIVRETVTLAGHLGAEGVVIGPGKQNPLLPAPVEQMDGWFHAALDDLVPHAEACGTRLLVENMPFAFLPGAEEMMASIERYGADAIGVVYDVANAHFIGEDLVAGFARVADRLHTVHLSDTGRRVYRHDPIGEGDCDFAYALEAARAAGHRRAAVLEIISTAADPSPGIDDSARRLAALGWDAIAA